MAIDFPASPTPGQVYQGYCWDDTKGAWRSVQTNSSAVITSPTTPTGATAGDLWFNSNDGTLYVYYNDGIQTYWTEIKANSALGTTLDSRLEVLEKKSHNYILNGDMEINQRGLTSTPAYRFNSYLTDRWKGVNSEIQASVQDVSDSTVPAFKALRIGVNNGEYSNMHIAQKLENIETKRIRNKTVTLSFYARFSSSTWTPTYGSPISFNYGIGVNTSTTDATISNVTFDSTTTSQIMNGSFPTNWTRLYLTATIPSNANNVTFYTAFGSTFSGTNSSLWYEITGVQLEEGSSATPFRRNQESIQSELASCKRYFQRYPGGVGCGLTGVANATTQLIMSYSLNVDMRIAPTPSSAGQIWISDQYVTDQSASSSSVTTSQGASTSGGRIVLAGFSGLTVGRWYSTPASSIGSGYLDFTAEL